jgi:integrase
MYPFKSAVPMKDLLSLPESAITRSGFQFHPQDDKWIIADLSHNISLDFRKFDTYCDSGLIQAFKKVLLFYVEQKSASFSDNIFFHFTKFVEGVTSDNLLSTINSTHIINYKATLSAKNEYYLTALAGFFKKWHALGYPGIQPEVPALLNQLRLKGNFKGEAVLTMDPEKGPFTEIELHGIYGALHDAYSQGRIQTRHYVLTLLYMALGPRNIQLAALKTKDLTVLKARDGPSSYLLNVPRAKQRGQNIRDELKSRALDHDIGHLLEAHIENVKEHHQKNITDKIDAKELPLFPYWFSSNPAGFTHHSNGNDLYKEIAGIFQKLTVTSERTGKKIKVSPTRFRRTIGTRAAMEGHGELIIADLLDHTDTQNVGVYVEATPEIIDRIDKALALHLAPMAQAFMGIIIEDESKAERGDDPASRIRSPNIESAKGGSVGSCGKYGFCGAYAPIACYTCRKFQAWLDGPHETVLEELILKRERTLEQTGDERIAFVNDRTILAVAEVVRKCKELKLKEADNA